MLCTVFSLYSIFKIGKVKMKELSYEEVNVNKVVRNDSYFDGKFIEYLGYKLLSFLITICTLFIEKPRADKIIIEYKINHTFYNGKLDNIKYTF